MAAERPFLYIAILSAACLTPFVSSHTTFYGDLDPLGASPTNSRGLPALSPPLTPSQLSELTSARLRMLLSQHPLVEMPNNGKMEGKRFNNGLIGTQMFKKYNKARVLMGKRSADDALFYQDAEK